MLEDQSRRESAQWKATLEKREKAHMNALIRSEEKLTQRVKRLEANETAVIKEQVMIADERVLQVREELQKEVD